jgi:uncharacterized protein
MIYPRHTTQLLSEAASDTPVILLVGARQTGKSTLLSRLMPQGLSLACVTLDDLSVLEAMRTRPQSYLSGLPEQVVIDEVQRAPEIFLPIKESVDQNRKPGRYFLTGSANVLVLPRLADTLAGRMEVVTLWPLSQGELNGQREGFIETVFASGPLPRCQGVDDPTLFNMLVTGGYPEAVQRETPRRRSSWFSGYITTLLQRDVRELSNIEGLSSLPNLLALLATRTGGLLNVSDLSRSVGIANATLHRYLNLLEAIFLVISVPPWHTNLGKRLVKAPRLYLNDTGILCHLLQTDGASLATNRNLLGPVLENFVVMELIKQRAWSNPLVTLSHYRTHTGQEVDIVLEAGQRIVGIEVKSASTITQDHFKGLRSLQADADERFHRGIVLYTGNQVVQFDDTLWAVPISALWTMGARV